MNAAIEVPAALLRVGDVAELAGTTPRTIRYYEEIGLLTPEGERRKGGHRVYSAADVERVREVMRFRDLLGLSLEQLSTLIEVESVRRTLRDEWSGATTTTDRRRILRAALQCADTQLELVHHRQEQLAQLEDEVSARRRTIESRLSALQVGRAGQPKSAATIPAG